MSAAISGDDVRVVPDIAAFIRATLAVTLGPYIGAAPFQTLS